jgi:hypothetical protein
VLGDPAEQRARLETFATRGIELPVLLVVPVTEVDPDGYGSLVETLAPGG